MNLILKQILIILTSFVIILWFQNVDDKKNNRERKTYYEKYKFPILVGSIVGLIINLPELFGLSNCVVENITDITVLKPVTKCDITPTEVGAKPFVIDNNFGMNTGNKLSWFDESNNITSQQIYTDMPDF